MIQCSPRRAPLFPNFSASDIPGPSLNERGKKEKRRRSKKRGRESRFLPIQISGHVTVRGQLLSALFIEKNSDNVINTKSSTFNKGPAVARIALTVLLAHTHSMRLKLSDYGVSNILLPATKMYT